MQRYDKRFTAYKLHKSGYIAEDDESPIMPVEDSVSK
jgi:hypothetical protein